MTAKSQTSVTIVTMNWIEVLTRWVFGSPRKDEEGKPSTTPADREGEPSTTSEDEEYESCTTSEDEKGEPSKPEKTSSVKNALRVEGDVIDSTVIQARKVTIIKGSDRPPTDDRDLLHKLKTMLVSDYVTLQGPTVPWLEERTEINLDKIFIDLEMRKRDRTDPADVWTSGIQLKDIFANVANCTEEIQVLIEGGPGIGKSTVALKMVHDWANGVSANVDNYMTSFDLVVLLPLRRLGNNSLETFLGNALKLSDHSEDEILKEVKKRKCLFILDGYDELSQTHSDVLTPLLEKRAFGAVSLVVVSRPGKTAKFNRRFDRRIIIKGIPEEQQAVFLDQYLKIFDRKGTQSLTDKLQMFNFKNNFWSCPLLTILVALLARECDPAKLVTTTDVYKQFFHFIVRRSLPKIERPDEKIDLFRQCDSGNGNQCQFFASGSGNENQWPFYVGLMDKFGKLAFNALKDRQEKFEKSEILDYFDQNDETILQMDFFTVNQSFGEGKVDNWYEPVQLTFFEFGAAFHLWLSRHQLEEKYLKLEVVAELFSKHWTDRPCERPELVFFGELLGEEMLGEERSRLLVRALRMCHEEYCRTGWFYNFGFRLNELQTENDLLFQLDHFIPHEWEVGKDSSFNTSPLHREILSRKIMSEKIVKRIVWDVKHDVSMPEKVQLESLTLKVHKEVSESANTEGDKIQCHHLECEVHDSYLELEKRRKFTLLLEKINFNDISFSFWYPDKCTVWLLQIYEKLTIRNIRYRLQSGNVQTFVTTIESLVDLGSVLGLEVDIDSSDSDPNSGTVPENPPQASYINWDRMWKSFFKTAGKSTLRSLKLVNRDETNVIVVNNDLLTNRGRKHWEELYFAGNVKYKPNN